jgi:RimJ/RimL family protein N-acetyltransferase
MEMNEVILETERLRLRWLREDDFEQYAKMCRDPDVMRFLGGQVLNDIEIYRQMAYFMGHWYFRGYGIWGVEEKSTGNLVGRIGFMDPIGWPAFELGWTLSRESWGKGYATEGARRALAYAFTELNREHVISLIAPLNVSSGRVAERLGETIEGQTQLYDKDVLVYGIGRDEWFRSQGK